MAQAAKTKGPTSISERDRGIRERFEFLAKHFSQATIARKTGVARSYITRYLQGRKIPSSFCTALVTELGVNATWLLTGQGTPFINDISAHTADTASDLLGMVKAMSSVSQMQLGALVGKEYAKTLHDLDATIQRHDQLQTKLTRKVRPLLEKIFEECQGALREGNVQKMRGLKEAGIQLERLCDVPDFSPRLHIVFGSAEAHEGNNRSALEHFKKALYLRISSLPELAVEEVFGAISIYTQLLQKIGYIDEALRAYRSTLELIGDAPENQAFHNLILFHIGHLEILAGNLPEGIGKVHSAFYSLPTSHQEGMQALLLKAMLWSGALSWDQAHADNDCENRVKTTILLEHAIWLEDAEKIRTIIDTTTSDEAFWSFDRDERRWTKSYLACLEKPDPKHLEVEKGRLKPLLEGPIDDMNAVSRFRALYRYAKLARSVEAKKQAQNACLEAHQILLELPSTLQLTVMQCAEHYRNVLTLFPKNPRSPQQRELTDQAHTFFSWALDRGYGFTKSHNGMG